MNQVKNRLVVIVEIRVTQTKSELGNSHMVSFYRETGVLSVGVGVGVGERLFYLLHQGAFVAFLPLGELCL